MNLDRRKMFNALFPKGKAYPYQMDWAKDDSKYKLGVKARQIGVTYTEAVDNFIHCLLWQADDKNPVPPVIVAASPSQRQSNRLMEYMMRVRERFEKIYKAKVQFKKEREDLLRFDNGSEFWSLPNNPRTIEGLDANRGIIDEGANFSGREDEEVYQALMGSLAAKAGSLVIFGRPRGRRGLFWKLFDPQGPYAKEFSIFKFPWTIRAEVDKSYKKSVLSQKLVLPPLAFEEQYNCGFVDENVLVFTYELLESRKEQYAMWQPGAGLTSYPRYVGIDFGEKQSESAVTLVESAPDKARVRFHETTNKPFNWQMKWFHDLIKSFSPYRIIIDATGLGLPILSEFQTRYGEARVSGINFSNQNKEKMIMSVYQLLQSCKLALPYDPSYNDLIDQIHGIEKEVLDSGRIKYTGKRSETGWLDDRFWSLALACFELQEPEFSMTLIGGKKDNLTEYEKWVKDLDDDGNPN